MSVERSQGFAATERAPAWSWALPLIMVCVLIAVAELSFRASGWERRFARASLYNAKAFEFQGADVLFTGDSRILHGFDSGLAQADLERARGERLRVYNAGLSGAPPMAQLALVRRA